MKRAAILFLSILICSGAGARKPVRTLPEGPDSLSRAIPARDTLLAPSPVDFGPDSLDIILSDEFLDTVNVKKSKVINDYTLIGANYGISFSTMYFNPSKMNSKMVFNPNYISLMYTRYGKMFGYIQNFGFTGGIQMSHEGYEFVEDEETHRIAHVDSATVCTMTTFEIPVMAQIHVDFYPCKIMANVGVYGGYRYDIKRSGVYMDKRYESAFRSYEHRWEYGLQGGVGFGVMFDPVELHFNLGVRWSWSSLYEPDYYSNYYYRFAYPIDIFASIGVHFQLTKRSGKTTSSLKKEAKKTVYEPKNQDN